MSPEWLPRPTSDLAAAVEGIVHEPTQVDDGRVDLTVAEIYELRKPGRIDFGGGELEPAGLEPHPRVWRDEDDDYSSECNYLLVRPHGVVRSTEQ